MRGWFQFRMKRLRRWRAQVICHHDWLNATHPVTLVTRYRVCRNCLKKQRAVIRWKRP